MRVVGLDLSLTRTGVAHIRDTATGTVASAGSIKTSADDGKYVSRRERLRTIYRAVIGKACLADLVVIEGPALSRNNPGTWDRAGLWWLVMDALTQVAVVPPTTLKDWATGSGKADKKAVRRAAENLWPGIATNDDESDALALATMGAQRLGMDVPSIEYHKFIIASDAVQWPASANNPGDGL